MTRTTAVSGAPWVDLRGRGWAYLPSLRRWTRVFFSSLRCFFFAMRLRRFLMTEPTGDLSRLTVREAHESRCRGTGPA